MDIKERIILEVERNSVLFDKSHPNYKRADLKEDIWSGIGKKLGISGTDAQTKWRNIRDCMAKHVKKNKSKSGQACTAKKTYTYEHILGFLIPTLNERATNSNLNDNIEPEDEDDDCSLQDTQTTQVSDEEVEPENTAQVTKPSTSTPRPPPKKRRSSLPVESMDTVIMDYIKKNTDECSKSPAPKVEDDDIMLFLKSLAPTIRRFPPRVQADARFAISKVIHDAEMEYLYTEETSSVHQFHVMTPNPSRCVNDQMYDPTYRRSDTPSSQISNQSINSDSMLFSPEPNAYSSHNLTHCRTCKKIFFSL